MKCMKIVLFALLAAHIGWETSPLCGQDKPAPTGVQLTGAVKVFVDQIGYRTNGRKVAILGSPDALPEKITAKLIDVKTGKEVWKSEGKENAIRIFKNNQKDGESGDYVAHLDFSDFKTPGRYQAVVNAGGEESKSYEFNIADNVYRDAGLAAWRSLYYQRADTELPEKYAGPWAHKADHRGPNQATEARVYKWNGNKHWDPVGTEVADPAPHDVSGSWWDAGNFDKYIGNTHVAHNDLLLGVQLIGAAARDGDLNIPESGNKYPDILDEVRYSTDWFIRMADDTGAAWGRVYEKPDCPPEKDTSPVMLTEQTSGATMNRCSALAYAALVWNEIGKDQVYAKKCFDAALKSWKLLEQKPHPWPEDPGKPGKAKYTGEWFFANYDTSRALAAACFFKLTGDKKYDEIVRESYSKFNWTNNRNSGEQNDLWPVIYNYSRTPGADPELVKKMKEQIFAVADGVANSAGDKRGYRMSVRGFWWGSNTLVGHTGGHCVLAAELTDVPEARKKYLEAAEEFVHYLFGRNPLGLCWFTNMKKFGAQNSIMIMFHSWLGNDGKKNDPYGGKFIGEGPDKVGPAPGYVVGGPNGSMKKYVMGLHWTQSPWEYNEPCLGYQGACNMLVTYFAYKPDGKAASVTVPAPARPATSPTRIPAVRK